MADEETTIRLIRVDDAGVIAAHRARDRQANATREPAQPDEFYTEAGQRRRIETLLGEHDRGERWPAVILADGEVVGQVTVSTILRAPFRKGFLGYWVASASSGRGHATRAVSRILTVMTEELGLHRAEAHTRMDNLASQRVLRANGFQPWGVAHAHIFLDGAWHDEVFWERTLDDAPSS
ncbi:GNAT family N-acetyltransferase [Microbispora bryophytorum]|uniref:Ribosomal-protein-alanine N-acetyltransferase n=1 Tax=Microbispora bryophytorum TaxID=1460882 RepID=A0A8H9L9U2_9ACTN|nr:GNAT family protein [Microbispora bryophytorum]MBD3139645.1 GNAT family N-acetyltransferase [Microbispora bryophytorum]TQS02930.1 GNAT family N-acetyltransferase [Microbispora bryophytorum]GGO03086.1 ribosomal-protein-alanine N-acetyltransferase [Microbispora bryophytorum]